MEKDKIQVEVLYRESRYGSWQPATIEFDEKTWKHTDELAGFCQQKISKNMRKKAIEIRVINVPK